MTLEPGQTVGNYEVVGRLGEGGFASVYRVRHRYLDTDHALKVLHEEHLRSEEARQRFLAEAQVQARLRHPNIVAVTDVVAIPGIAGLVMEMVEGRSLAEEIEAAREPPPVEQVRACALPILDAVGFAHEQGVIHRDLKPENILLAVGHDGGWIPKVTDFGIAKILRDVHGGVTPKRSTIAHRAMGTSGYMSPEQIRSAKDVGPAADIFALGATFLEYATLRPPFRGDSEYDVMHAIISGSFEIPSWFEDAAPGVAAALGQALSPDSTQRFGSCRAFASALRADGGRSRPRSSSQAALTRPQPPGPAPRAGDPRPGKVARRPASPRGIASPNPWLDRKRTGFWSAWARTVKAVVLEPNSFFGSFDRSAREGFRFFAAVSSIALSGDLVRAWAAADFDTTFAIVAVLMVPVLVVLGWVLLWIGAWSIRVGLRASGSVVPAQRELLEMMAYAAAPGVIRVLPVVGPVLAVLWGLVVQLIGVKHLAGVSAGRAVWAWFLGVLIFAGVGGAVGMVIGFVGALLSS